MAEFENFMQLIRTKSEHWKRAREFFEGPMVAIILSTGPHGMVLLEMREAYNRGMLHAEDAEKQLAKLSENPQGMVALALMKETWKLAQEEQGVQALDGFMELVDQQIEKLGDEAPQVVIRKGGPGF